MSRFSVGEWVKFAKDWDESGNPTEFGIGRVEKLGERDIGRLVPQGPFGDPGTLEFITIQEKGESKVLGQWHRYEDFCLKILSDGSLPMEDDEYKEICRAEEIYSALQD